MLNKIMYEIHLSNDIENSFEKLAMPKKKLAMVFYWSVGTWGSDLWSADFPSVLQTPCLAGF